MARLPMPMARSSLLPKSSASVKSGPRINRARPVPTSMAWSSNVPPTAEADAGAGAGTSAHGTIAVDCLLMNAVWPDAVVVSYQRPTVAVRGARVPGESFPRGVPDVAGVVRNVAPAVALGLG